MDHAVSMDEHRRFVSWLIRVQETDMHTARIKCDILIRICQAVAYFNGP